MQKSWPSLDYFKWKDTYATLHRWVQIMGKLRTSLSPWANHSWNSALYVSSRGLSSSPIPLGERNLTLEFDFIDHELNFEDSQGNTFTIILQNESVSSFYARFLEALKVMKVDARFSPLPSELPDAIPFHEDNFHRTYNKEHASAFFQALVRVSNVFQHYRANFSGKSSPVHFFWGSFDLAVTRFSGRKAPEHPGGIPNLSDEIAREAYSHEVLSCGFWPGNDSYPHAAFYSYVYPEPPEFYNARIVPSTAFYHKDLREFLLPYEVVRQTGNPDKVIMDFLNSSYESAVDLSKWNLDWFEPSHYLRNIRNSGRFSFVDNAIRQ